MTGACDVGRRRGVVLPWLCGVLLCAGLSMPPLAISGTLANKVQRQVLAIDAQTREQAPWRERPVQGLSAEGARAVAWGRPGVIEKISVEALGERGRMVQDFYWRRGVLIAARQRHIDYGAYIMDLPKDKPTPMKVVEDEWLEFSGHRVLRRRSLEGDLPKADPSARQRAAQLQADARSFKRLMTTPDATYSGDASCLWVCSRDQRGECLVYQCR